MWNFQARDGASSGPAGKHQFGRDFSQLLWNAAAAPSSSAGAAPTSFIRRAVAAWAVAASADAPTGGQPTRKRLLASLHAQQQQPAAKKRNVGAISSQAGLQQAEGPAAAPRPPAPRAPAAVPNPPAGTSSGSGQPAFCLGLLTGLCPARAAPAAPFFFLLHTHLTRRCPRRLPLRRV